MDSAWEPMLMVGHEAFLKARLTLGVCFTAPGTGILKPHVIKLHLEPSTGSDLFNSNLLPNSTAELNKFFFTSFYDIIRQPFRFIIINLDASLFHSQSYWHQ